MRQAQLSFAVLLLISIPAIAQDPPTRAQPASATSRPANSPGGSADYPFKEGYALQQSDNFLGSAEISVTPKQVKTDQSSWAEIMLRASMERGFDCVFNPFLDPDFGMPAVLALYDADHKYLGNYFSYVDDVWPRHRSTLDGAWIDLGPGRRIGVAVRFLGGRLPGSIGTDPPLKPGKYYLQVIYLRAFLGDASNGRRADPDNCEQFRDHFNRTELFRSNACEIELVP